MNDILAHTPADQADGAQHSSSRSCLDEVVGLAWMGGSDWSQEKQQAVSCTADVLKSVPLFLRGRYALPATIVLYALDEMHSDSSVLQNGIDGTLGAAKGYLTKTAFSKIGQSSLTGPVLKGSLSGISSRAIELGLSSETYRDSNGSFSGISEGLLRAGKGTFHPKMLAADVVASYGAGKAVGGIDRFTNGAISASPFLSTLSCGGTYGFVFGSTSEFERQFLNGESLDVGDVLSNGLREAGISGLAAIPGAYQHSRMYTKQQLSQSEIRAYDRWKEFREFKSTEQPRAGRFVRETMSYTERRQLWMLDIKPADVVAIKREINAVAVPAERAILDSVSGSRVIGIGEAHIDPSPHRAMGARLMPELAKAGVTDLAIEWPMHWQRHLNNYTENGVVQKHRQQSFGASHWRVVESGVNSGMKPSAVDPIASGFPDSTRDIGMARNIQTILADPGRKVAFWVGCNHLGKSPVLATENPSIMSIQKGIYADKTPAGQLLREAGVPITTFTDSSVSFNLIKTLTSDLRSSIAIPMEKAPLIGALKNDTVSSAPALHPYNQFDFVVAHHHPRTPFGYTRQYLSYFARPLLHPRACYNNLNDAIPAPQETPKT